MRTLFISYYSYYYQADYYYLISKLLMKFSDANTMFPLKRTQKGRSMGGVANS